MKPNSTKLNILLHSLALGALLFSAPAQADYKKAGPTGTWSWKTTGRDGGPERVNKLTLTAEGDKLTGKLAIPGREGKGSDIPISDGKVEGDAIAFNVVREFNGHPFTIKYSGKVSADTITGKTEFESNGKKQSRDWVAKREVETK